MPEILVQLQALEDVDIGDTIADPKKPEAFHL